MHIIIAVSALSFNPFVLLLKGFIQLLGSVAEWGPVFNVSLELFLTDSLKRVFTNDRQRHHARYNIIHLTNWAFNRTDGIPNLPAQPSQPTNPTNCKGRVHLILLTYYIIIIYYTWPIENCSFQIGFSVCGSVGFKLMA